MAVVVCRRSQAVHASLATMDTSHIKIEEEDVLEPHNSQLFDLSEPVIDFAVYVRQENDPLSNEDFKIVPIDILLPSQPTIDEPAAALQFNVTNAPTEVASTEPACTRANTVRDARVTPCSILLDAKEILQYYCAETKQYKLPSTQIHQNARKRIWSVPMKRERSPSPSSISEASSSNMDFSPSYSPVYHDNSDSDNSEVQQDNYEPQSVNSRFRRRKHICKKCNKICASEFILSQHLKLHSKSNKIIKLQNKSNKIVNTHITKENDVQNTRLNKQKHVKENIKPKYMCTICKNDYITKEKLQLHLKIHVKGKKILPKDDKLFQCTICNKKFMTLNSLKKHIINHTHNEPYSCDICLLKFKYSEKLKKHFKRMHPTHEPVCTIDYKVHCSFCDLEFNSHQELKNHLKCVHNRNNVQCNKHPRKNILQYKCDLCSAKYILKSKLKMHVINYHLKNNSNIRTIQYSPKLSDCTTGSSSINKIESITIKKEYSCAHCSQILKSKENITKHIKKHLNNKIFVCDFCCENYDDKSELETHILNNHYKSLNSTVISKNDQKMTFGIIDIIKKSSQNSTSKNHKSLKLKCNICSKQYNNKRSFKRHIINHNYKIPPYSCTICLQTLSTIDSITKHQKSFHPNDKRKIQKNVEHLFKCRFCNRMLKNSQALTCHIIKKHNKKGYKQINTQKVKKINIRRGLKHHNVGQNHKKDLYTCTICSKKFASLDTIKKHYKLIHPYDELKLHQNIEQILKCSFCNEVLKNSQALTLHIKQNHNEKRCTLISKVTNCNICNKKYNNHRNLKRHIISHNYNKALYSCTICLKRFACLDTIKKHHKMIHPYDKLKLYQNIEQILKCRFCNEIFKSTPLLVNHLIENHNNKENYKIITKKQETTCNICTKNFLNNKNLCRHILSHNIYKHYQCNICSRTFLCSEYVKTHHKIVHKNEEFIINHTKQFRCRFCDKKCISELILSAHLVSKHNYPNSVTKKNVQYKCDFCYVNYNEKSLLKYHIISQHIKNVYYCEQCGEAFCNNDDLNYHITSLHGIKAENADENDIVDNNKHISMKLKEKDPIFSIRITRHVTSKKTSKFQCNICNKKFNVSKLLFRHILVHNKHNPYSCNICNQSFQRCVNIRAHYKSVHPNDKFIIKNNINQNEGFKCTYCNEICKNERELSYHLLFNHNNIGTKNSKMNLYSKIKPYFCNNCGDTFKLYNYLKDHYIKHHKNCAGYYCNYCLHKYYDKNTLEKHIINIHINDYFYCQICQISFNEINLFYNHYNTTHNNNNGQILKHHIEACDVKPDDNDQIPENKIIVFVCKICQSQQTSKEKIINHVIIHSVLKSFNCDYCDSIYKNIYSIKKHVLENHKNITRKNYICIYCNENYYSKQILEVHILKIHLKKKYMCTICRLCFPDRKSYNKHIDIPHFNISCDNAKQIKTISDAYDMQYINKSVIKEERYVCELCNKFWRTKESLRIHNINYHDLLGVFICKECGQKFNSKNTFKSHLHNKHEIEVNIECTFCNDVYTSKYEMFIHLANNHLEDIYKKTNEYKFNYITYIKYDNTSISDDVMNLYCLSFKTTADIPKNLKIEKKCVVKTSFLCRYCGRDCKVQRHLKKHEDTHRSGKRFKCFQCHVAFKTFQSLFIHLTTFHAQHNYVCEICNDNFYLKSELRKHVEINHLNITHNENNIDIYNDDIMNINNITNYLYYCSICKYVNKNRCKYNKHVKSKHPGIKISKDSDYLICQTCEKTFNQKINVVRHMIEKHSKNEIKTKKNSNEKTIKLPFECKLCTDTFPNIDKLKMHTNIEHSEVKNTTCPYCDQVYSKLATHINSVHLDVQTYQCKFCTEILTGILVYKKHIRTQHTTESTKAKCNECNELCESRQALKYHMECMHSDLNKNNHLCHLCASVFYGAATLNAHLKSAHDIDNKKIKNKKRVICPTCKRDFCDMGGLNRHIAIDHKKIRYSCTVCNEKFKSVYTLKSHKYLIHKLGYVKTKMNYDYQYKCSHCTLSFRKEESYHNHYIREHAPCTCDICDRKLLGKHSVKKHLEYSHGFKEKVYRCKKCDHVAVTKGRLKKHMVVHKTKKRKRK